MAIQIDFYPAGDFIPHTNHTHWSSELQVTVFTIQDQFMGSTSTTVPEDYSSDQGI